MPKTSAILTLGCAKYRLLGQDYGNIPGTDLPRLMDMGQCNDSYAAVSPHKYLPLLPRRIDSFLRRCLLCTVRSKLQSPLRRPSALKAE